MLETNERAREVWARTTLKVWPEDYCLVSLPPSALPGVVRLLARGSASFLALAVTPDDVSLTLPAKVWAKSALAKKALATTGPYRVLTFEAEVEPDLCGYLAPVADRLAEVGISIVPQCAFSRDHMLVRAADLEKASRVIQDWIRRCRA